nr:class I SAM-dependent methyltransferase [Bifidobacterium bifidum]
QGYGIDNDDELLAVASVSVSLQREPVELFHQDAIEPLTIPQSDLAVSDLPVGYYPLDENTKNYQTRAEK